MSGRCQCGNRRCRGECTNTNTVTCVDTFPEPPPCRKPKCPPQPCIPCQPRCPQPCNPCNQPNTWQPCPPQQCPPQQCPPSASCVSFCCGNCGQTGQVKVPKDCPVYLSASTTAQQGPTTPPA